MSLSTVFSEKEALAAQLKELSDKLDQSDNDREELSKKIGQIKAQVNDQVGRVAELQVSLEATKYAIDTYIILIIIFL